MARKWIATSAAICVMWIAVLFIAIFAPELRSHGVAGDYTTLPLAGIIAAGCAFIATIVVANVGFGSSRNRDVDLAQEQLERERRVRELKAQRPSQDESPKGTARPLVEA